METEHINKNKFIDGSEIWPNSITVDWGILSGSNTITLGKQGDTQQPYYYNSNTLLKLSKCKVYVGNLLISKEEFLEKSSDSNLNKNTLEWKNFWCLDGYHGQYDYDISELINTQVSGDIERIDALLTNSPITSSWYRNYQSNVYYPTVCSENLSEDSQWYHNFIIVRIK